MDSPEAMSTEENRVEDEQQRAVASNEFQLSAAVDLKATSGSSITTDNVDLLVQRASLENSSIDLEWLDRLMREDPEDIGESARLASSFQAQDDEQRDRTATWLSQVAELKSAANRTFDMIASCAEQVQSSEDEAANLMNELTSEVTAVRDGISALIAERGFPGEVIDAIYLGRAAVEQARETARGTYFVDGSEFDIQAADLSVDALYSEVVHSIMATLESPSAAAVSPATETLQSDLQTITTVAEEGTSSLTLEQRLILEQLKQAQRDLLGVETSNPLVAFKRSPTRGVSLENVDTSKLFKRVVSDGARVKFRPTMESASNDASGSTKYVEQRAQKRNRDGELTTIHVQQDLQKRLLHTKTLADKEQRDTGSVTLHLTLDTVEWWDSDKDIWRSAPLMAIPGRLLQRRVDRPYEFEYTGAELETNHALAARLKRDRGVNLPEVRFTDDFDYDRYCKEVAAEFRSCDKIRLKKGVAELNRFYNTGIAKANFLDPKNWPEDRQPYNHPSMSVLFLGGAGARRNRIQAGETVDDHYDPRKTTLIQAADGSQLRTQLEMEVGACGIIQGPPGTGKSQSITNTIASAVGQGKRVLFVSSKLAALRVVRSQLDAAGLGDMCMELHGSNTAKGAAARQFKQALKAGKPVPQDLEEAADKLLQSQANLNAHRKAMASAVGDSGLTPAEIIGELAQLKTQKDGTPNFSPEFMAGWSEQQYRDAARAAADLQAHITLRGKPFDNPFCGCGLEQESTTIEAALEEQIQSAREAMSKLRGTATSVAARLRLPSSKISGRDFLGLISGLAIIEKEVDLHPDLSKANPRAPIWKSAQEERSAPALEQEVVKAGRRYQELEAKYGAQLLGRTDLYSQLAALKTNLEGGKGKRVGLVPKTWFNQEYSAAKKETDGFHASAKSMDIDQRIDMIDQISEALESQKLIEEHTQRMSAAFGELFDGTTTKDWNKIVEAARVIRSIYAVCESTSEFERVLDALRDPAGVPKFGSPVREIKRLVDHFEAAKTTVLETLAFSEAWVDAIHRTPIADQDTKLRSWEDASSELQTQIEMNRLIATCRQLGLGPIMDKLLSPDGKWNEPDKNLVDAVRATYLKGLVDAMAQNMPSVGQFNAVVYERRREEMRDAVTALQKKNVAAVAEKVWHNRPSVNIGGRVGLLMKEATKGSKFTPIRELLEGAADAATRVCPVFLMSPDTVARYLSPMGPSFDLVIFDEASMIRPAEALGPILLAEQFILAGDDQQMPPTSLMFGSSIISDGLDTDEVSETAEHDSVLGFASAKGVPSTALNMHYRSRHPSLIAVSNLLNYGGNLVTFPSPYVNEDRLGLKFEHVADGVYDRGKTRTNAQEAKRVAQLVIQHAKEKSHLSLGVVALNAPQAELIQDEINALRLKESGITEDSPATNGSAVDEDEELSPVEEFFTSKHEEAPFFVTNLESVQGDERDSLIVSLGYGPTEENRRAMRQAASEVELETESASNSRNGGNPSADSSSPEAVVSTERSVSEESVSGRKSKPKTGISMSFGPVNNPGGHRRLNVLMTRAKEELTVVSSLRAEDIDLERTESVGVEHLRQYLQYAETRELGGVSKERQQKPPTALQQYIIDELSKHGYQCVANIGDSGCYVDIAIREKSSNAGDQEKFLLGVMLDGENFQGIEVARDREIVVPTVLEQMGWNLHCSYAMEHQKQPKRAIDGILNALKSAEKGEPKRYSNPANGDIRPERSEIERAQEQDSPIVPYEIAQLTLAHDAKLKPMARNGLVAAVVTAVKEQGSVAEQELITSLIERANTPISEEVARSELALACSQAQDDGYLFQTPSGELTAKRPVESGGVSRLVTSAPPEPGDSFASYVGQIVAAEAPVHINEVYRRLRVATSTTTNDETARLAVDITVSEALMQRKMRRDGDFLLSMDKNAEVVIRDRGDKVDFPTLHRKHDLIPSGEITAQIQYVVKASMGIKREDLPKSVLQGFGWSTVNDGARDRIDAHVEELIQSGAIVESEGYLIEGQLH